MVRPLIPLVLLVSALAAQEEAPDTYPELVAAFEKAAASDGAEAAAQDHAPRFLAAAERLRGKPAAIPMLLWVVQHGGLAADATAAAEALVRDHVTDPALAAVAERLPFLATYGAAVDPLLQRLLAGNGHPEVQAKALFARASMVFTRLDPTSEQLMAAREDLAKAAKLTKDKALAARAEAMAADDRSLAIGSVAPEIAGFDLDGAPFRLSDYRGKVVVLDFWGDW